MRNFAICMTILALVFLSGCSSEVLLKVDSFDVDELDSSKVLEWINNNPDNGIYVSQSKDDSVLYLYVNYSNLVNGEIYKVSSTSIGSTIYVDSINIKAVPELSTETSERVFFIQYDRKRIKAVKINDEVIKLDNITVID